MEIYIWQFRTKKKLSLCQLEELTGISKSTINNLENAKTSPTLRELELLAKAMDCKIVDLFDSDYKI
ncbi:MAG: helix-turn-helix domain-containing protein [Anaerostipes sp.]|jgi:transcriptional regulator with XRE-family HTH domain|nr:helix-turn-helix transcriptional regulator [Anaerostipes sp.]